MPDFLSGEVIVGFLTLLVLEIVLGIDNVIFISILANKLPADQQKRARRTGLLMALGSRILLLFAISWVVGLTAPLFSIFGQSVSGRDLILFGGGLFLIAKATKEIHERLEGEAGHASDAVPPSFTAVIIQILILDVVFSLDSVITAVGMVDQIGVMIAAVVVAVGIMLFSAEPISKFVNDHPTVKMLALSFLLLIGLTLVIEAFHQHIPKEYIYFAIAFSVFVEFLNLRASAKKKTQPVQLHQPYAPLAAGTAGSTTTGTGSSNRSRKRRK
jgi:predicted tellurium resistance membrane protein TerC